MIMACEPSALNRPIPGRTSAGFATAALFAWWRARGRRAHDQARLVMFDAVMKAMTAALQPSSSSPQ